MVMTHDTIFDLPAPANLDAERFVLGSAMTETQTFEQIAGVLTADDFSLEKHRRIFLRMADLHERGEAVDRVTLAEELKRHGQLQSVDGLSYLVSLDEGMPALHSLDRYCAIIRDKAAMRRAIEACHALVMRCYQASEPPSELLADAERVTEILNSSSAKLAARSPSEIIEAAGGWTEFLSPTRTPGIPIPFPDIQDTLRGLRPKKLIVIAARPGVGKSAFSWELGYAAALAGKRVLFVSLEMAGIELLERAVMSRAGVSQYKHRDDLLTSLERRALQEQASVLNNADNAIKILEDPDTTILQVRGLLRALASRGWPVDLLVIDYIQLLDSVGHFDTRAQAISFLTRHLKKIAIAFGIPVIAISQLNRDSEKQDREPRLSDLRDSGSIEQDADQVMFLWLKREPDQKQDVREISWKVEKNRDGNRNRGVLTFYPKICKFGQRTKDSMEDLQISFNGNHAAAAINGNSGYLD